jgi:hypothetical protein
MLDLSERSTARNPMFSRPVNLDDWSNDQAPEIPWWIAIRARLALQQRHASLLSAVHLVAQIKMITHDEQREELRQLLAETIDEWCHTQEPAPCPAHPHWTAILKQLGLLANRYAAGSELHDAVFELSRRVLNRAQELSQPPGAAVECTPH